MSNVDGGDFFDKDKTKQAIPIENQVTKYDDVLDTFGEDSNRLVTDILTLHSTDPQALDAEQNASAQNVANYNTLCLWFTRQKDFNSVREWKDKFKTAKEALIAKLEADETQDTGQTVAVSSAYRTSPLDAS